MSKSKIESLTLKEKASILVGYKTMATFPVPEKGVESVIMSDGPNGLRIEEINGDSLTNITKAQKASCFPAGVTLTSSWNLDLANKMGSAIGSEAIHYGINVVLGPAVNIQRNPLCGRNFEYLSEDPLLSGKIGAELTKGIQSQGVGACIKHYACNNNEKYRYIGDSVVDMRALHEIYLKPFEIIVREADPRSIMTAYNQTNGAFCSENKYLIEDVLRNSWGFDGVVMTDWGGIVHRDVALKNGCDLEMPGMNDFNIKVIYDAVKNGSLDESLLDKSVQRIIDLKDRTRIKEQKQADFDAHYKLALDIALEGAVLLKNNGALPLSKDKKYLVIGGLFDTMRYQGSGSSLLNPIKIKDHRTAFNEAGIDYDFIMGYKESETEPDVKLETEALEKAKEYDTVIFFGGLNDYVESEGYDREDLRIPNNQLSLIYRLEHQGNKVVVVLCGGSPMELPFIDKVEAILDMMLPGEAGGEATCKLLFGEANPSGKLSQSWPLRYSDIPFGDEFVKQPYELYKESIFVGYRYYSTLNKEVLFPFGYGLSYSNFEYSNFSLKVEKDAVFARISVKNTGKVTGKETVQLYVSKENSNIVRPALELKGFGKVELKPGEEKTFDIKVPFETLKVFIDNEFKLEDGVYTFSVASNSNDIKFKSSVSIKGEKLNSSLYDEIYRNYLNNPTMDKETFEKVVDRKIPEYVFGKKPYTLETPIGELKGLFGSIFRNYVTGLGKKKYKKALKIEDPLTREREKKAGIFMVKLMLNNSLRSLSFSSSGLFDYPLALGIMHLSNNHIIKGIKAIKTKYEIKE